MQIFRRKTKADELIERYQQPLYWHIRRLVVSHDDAQDVLQDTFVQIFLHLSELRNADLERVWVYRIATNEALQWLRKKHEFVSLDTDEVSSLADSLMAEEYVDTGDALLLLFQQAILSLPTMQQAVFNLRYYDELPYDDIAEILNTTQGAAKTNYHIAKEKISNYILNHQ